ncbi:MAG: hypothetical protein EZS28_029742 [Streblomastix strix]|uniref:Transposable element Tc3 transposase n=1 Tax=Streblomastix strix TaxID=222440 RepID=A0A5J4UXX8_9EUKA|nr:MAG: hypothetical protein EZS28_029742 [Streblomastix strix]
MCLKQTRRVSLILKGYFERFALLLKIVRISPIITTDMFQVELNIKGINMRSIFFQQDGAPSHIAKSTKTFLEEMFSNRLIGKGLNLEWPPRSPDLTPLDLFL